MGSKINIIIILVVTLVTRLMAQKEQIVFVCEHGALKSVVAANYFNELAKKENLHWRAIARGVKVDEEVSKRTKEWLIGENLIEMASARTSVSVADISQSRHVYAFDPLPSEIRRGSTTTNWFEIKLTNGDYEQLKQDIQLKVRPLIDSLKNSRAIRKK